MNCFEVSQTPRIFRMLKEFQVCPNETVDVAKKISEVLRSYQSIESPRNLYGIKYLRNFQSVKNPQKFQDT